MCDRRPLLAALLLGAGLLAAGPARADGYADVRAQQVEVQRIDGQRAQLDGRRVRLERESRDLAVEIEQAKREPHGVRADLRLQDLLAGAKGRSDELERVAADLRARTIALDGARRKLIAASDHALAGSLPEARRLELARLRTVQATLLAAPNGPLGAIDIRRAAADPLDGPRELSEKADLLRDSEDKLRREVQRLASRIDDVERRRHLRERAGAIDEDWFGEATSNRKFARTTSTSATTSTGGTTTAGSTPASSTTAGGARSSDSSAAPVATPFAPAAPPSASLTPSPPSGSAATGGANTVPGSFTGGAQTPPAVPSLAPGGGSTAHTPTQSSFSDGETGSTKSETATVLRNLVDPSTLDELRRADGSDDLERQVRALRRAQGELEGLANELQNRARTLSRRADELKSKK